MNIANLNKIGACAVNIIKIIAKVDFSAEFVNI